MFFLGCTCFEFVKKEIKELYGNSTFFINPSQEISELTKQKLGLVEEKKINLNKVKFYTTGDIKDWSKNINCLSKLVFGEEVKVDYLKIIR